MQRNEIYDIWRVCKPRLYYYISERIRQKSDLEDILQEVFIKFWTNHSEIRDKDKTLNWLLSVSKNTIVDFYRIKENTIVKIPFDPSDIKIYAENYSDESKKLIPVINSLPVKYKAVLLMSEIYGLPHKEIAEQFDLTVSCVKTRVVRARKLLAEKMYECCVFEYDKYGNIIDCSEKQAYFDCLKKIRKKD